MTRAKSLWQRSPIERHETTTIWSSYSGSRPVSVWMVNLPLWSINPMHFFLLVYEPRHVLAAGLTFEQAINWSSSVRATLPQGEILSRGTCLLLAQTHP